MSGALQKQHQKILRNLMRSPSNKKCADCCEQCTVNVDTTHGIFICTNCSGIHREFGDRIKSISMAPFTQDEINLLQSQTNEDFNRVWMAKWTQGDMPLPLNADDNSRRAFLQAKYIEKRWYAKRTQAFQPSGYNQISFISNDETQSAVPNNEVEKLKKTIEDQALIIKNLKSDLVNSKKEIEKLQEEIIDCNEIIKASEESSNQENDSKNQQMVFLDSDTVQGLEKVCELGHGASGTVYKVFQKVTQNKTFVLKVMSNSQLNHDNFKNFLKEYELLSMLFHPNVIKTYGFFMSDENMPPSILLEYCPNNLEKSVINKMLTKSDIVVIIFQIAEGMKYVHFRNIIHRDLKPSNILIAEDGTIKIADFGISKLMTFEEQQTTMTQNIGTLNFMAPEISEDKKYDKKVDVYSFGMLLFFILNEGKLPNRTLRQIINGVQFPIPDNFTQFSKNLIKACLEIDPNVRPDFNTICEEIEKNGFQLLNLSSDEKQNVNNRIKRFKRKIPSY